MPDIKTFYDAIEDHQKSITKITPDGGGLNRLFNPTNQKRSTMGIMAGGEEMIVDTGGVDVLKDGTLKEKSVSHGTKVNSFE